MSKDKPFIIFFVSSLVLAISSAAVMIVRAVGLKGGLIIHYDALSGQIVSGGETSLLALSLAGIFIPVLNFFLAKELYLKERFLAWFLMGVSGLIALLLVFFASVFLSVN